MVLLKSTTGSMLGRRTHSTILNRDVRSSQPFFGFHVALPRRTVEHDHTASQPENCLAPDWPARSVRIHPHDLPASRPSHSGCSHPTRQLSNTNLAVFSPARYPQQNTSTALPYSLTQAGRASFFRNQLFTFPLTPSRFGLEPAIHEPLLPPPSGAPSSAFTTAGFRHRTCAAGTP